MSTYIEHKSVKLAKPDASYPRVISSFVKRELRSLKQGPIDAYMNALVAVQTALTARLAGLEDLYIVWDNEYSKLRNKYVRVCNNYGLKGETYDRVLRNADESRERADKSYNAIRDCCITLYRERKQIIDADPERTCSESDADDHDAVQLSAEGIVARVRDRLRADLQQIDFLMSDLLFASKTAA